MRWASIPRGCCGRSESLSGGTAAPFDKLRAGSSAPLLFNRDDTFGLWSPTPRSLLQGRDTRLILLLLLLRRRLTPISVPRWASTGLTQLGCRLSCKFCVVPGKREKIGCDCGHLGRSVDLVARLLVNLGFCRTRFWYLVASGSGISRETSRIHFWNLTSSSVLSSGGVCDL